MGEFGWKGVAGRDLRPRKSPACVFGEQGFLWEKLVFDTDSSGLSLLVCLRARVAPITTHQNLGLGRSSEPTMQSNLATLEERFRGGC